MANRIGVIEADEIERIGRLSALGAAGCNVVDAGSPMDAVDWSDADWRRFDVVLFGVSPDSTSWDRYWSLDVARTAHEVHPNLRIIGLHHAAMHPLVRPRLTQAGIKRAWPALRARTSYALVELLTPLPHEADESARFHPDVRGAMVGPRTDPAAVLAYVEDEELNAVFDHTETQADTGLSRRAIIRVRRRITELGDLSVPAGFATGGPCVDRSLPSWRAIVDYVNSARGCAGTAGYALPAFAEAALSA